MCYNPKYCKYISDERKEELKKVGSQKVREYSVEYINELVQTAKENGYIASYNHPWWSIGDDAHSSEEYMELDSVILYYNLSMLLIKDLAEKNIKKNHIE